MSFVAYSERKKNHDLFTFHRNGRKEIYKRKEENKMETNEIKEQPIVQTNEEVKEQQTAMENIPVFETQDQGVDLKQFEGQKSKIVKYLVIDSITSYDETGHYKEGLKRPIKKLKIMTEPITKIETKDGNIEIRASELFGMKERDGMWGVSDSPKAGIQIFLKRQKVSKVEELPGTEVTIKANENKEGKTFLGFITE